VHETARELLQPFPTAYSKDQKHRNKLNQSKQVLKRVYGGQKEFNGADEIQKFDQGTHQTIDKNPSRELEKLPNPPARVASLSLNSQPCLRSANPRYQGIPQPWTLDFGLWTLSPVPRFGSTLNSLSINLPGTSANLCQLLRGGAPFPRSAFRVPRSALQSCSVEPSRRYLTMRHIDL
jgi:hypothetical protein